MTSLRDQLLGTNNDAVPEYSIVLPSGWTEHDASEGSEKALVDSADMLGALLGDIAVSVRPHIERVNVPSVGAGISVRFLVSMHGSKQPVAGIGYILTGVHGSVRVLSAPTTTTMVGLLDTPLRELVDHITLSE